VGALDDGRPPILIELGPSDDAEDDQLPVDTTVLRRPDPVLHAENPKDAYREALTALRERGEPARAKTMFAAFERRYPKSSLADNAVYWMGEAHFVLAEYRRAIACFERLEREYPRSSKIPYARLRWGESLLRAGQRDLAVARLREVVDLHADSPAAEEAERLLAGAGAKGKM
jgi:tol-pal system protein YbgF